MRRGHGSPPVLSEVFSSLAFRCALQRVQTVPAAIHSGRIPPPRQPIHGDGRLSQPPSPHRTWSVPDASSQPQLNLYFSDSAPSELLLGIQGHTAINKEDLTPQAVRSFFLLYSYKRGERRRLHCSLKRMSSPLAS